jgi:predicted ArsR family transcriptional regulator
MPKGVTTRVKRRRNEILKLIKANGCVTTTYIIYQLHLSHTRAYYTLMDLVRMGLIKHENFGKVALWCPSDIGNEVKPCRFVVVHSDKTVAIEVKKIYEALEKILSEARGNVVSILSKESTELHGPRRI